MASPSRSPAVFVLAGLMGCWAAISQAAPSATRTINVDLEPGIRASAARPERFAVDVPVTASAATDGTWSRAAGTSTWRHSIRIPTAVSMSFHASKFKLPAGASFRLSAGASKVDYTAGDAGTAGLWSRVLRGDTLGFEITVPTSRESQVVFELASLQAGYRGLDGSVGDHPFYKQLRAMTAAAESACIENFSCHETAANYGPRNATAAIVVGGVALCTATLVNNVRGDQSKYILTARHCQVPGSGDGGITLYWDGAVPCSAALGSVYDTLTPAYSGGGTRTLVEQQDVWLIEFGPDIAATHTYYAGWDATGGTFVGGYSAHHARSRTRQYVRWFGQAYLHDISNSALGTGYTGTFWGVVNENGSVGSGASGGALFDTDNRVTGTLSLALLPADGGDGVCPVASPPAPSASNTVAEYNALSSVWDSTADTTSTTNPATLKSFLDPDNTGTKVVDGFELLPGAYVSPATYNTFTGNALTINWSAPGATSCIAEGGHVGDGWSGSLGTSGTKQVNEEEGGDITYALRCTDGTRKTYVSARVNWTQTPPTVNLNVDPNYDIVVGQTKRFSWNSNTRNCLASGGVAGDGWAGVKTQSGSQDVVLGQIGSTSYTLTCTFNGRTATATHTTVTKPPEAFLESLGFMDNLRVGQSLTLFWSGAPNCVRSGGQAGDGWASATPGSGANTLVTPTAAGTYTYTLTCTGGGQSAVKTLTRTFNNLAPYVTVTATPNTSSVGWFASIGPQGQAGTPVQVAWTSNLPNCTVHITGPGGFSMDVFTVVPLFNVGNLFDTRDVIGTYTYAVSCSGGAQFAVGTATVDWTTTQQSIRISVPDTVAANQAFPVTWQSNVLPCTGVQGGAGDGWAGAKAGASGSTTVTEVGAGTYVFRIECGNVAAETTLIIPPPSVTVTPLNPHATVGFFPTINWSSTTSPCVLSSDPFNSDWTGTQYPSGQKSVTQQTPGTYTYTATCGPPGNTVTGSGQIVFDASPLPQSTFTADKTTANINDPVTLTWTSTNTDYCTPGANTTVNDWIDPILPAGTKTVTRTFPGTVTYYLNCNGASRKEVTVTFNGPSDANNPFIPPTVTLTSSHTQRVTGQTITLTWASTHASDCQAAGGQSGDGWTGALSLSASQSVTESTPGNYTYFVLCSGAPPSAQAQVTVQFLAPAPASGGGGTSTGGGGGGGRIDAWLAALLAALAAAKVTAARRRLT